MKVIAAIVIGLFSIKCLSLDMIFNLDRVREVTIDEAHNIGFKFTFYKMHGNYFVNFENLSKKCDKPEIWFNVFNEGGGMPIFSSFISLIDRPNDTKFVVSVDEEYAKNSRIDIHCMNADAEYNYIVRMKEIHKHVEEVK
jgi:hypothetical protein